MARVIIVDDSPDDRELLERWLIAHGHQVRAFSGAAKALSGVIGDPPDVLVTDLSMPGMDGLDLLQAIRAYYRLQHLPVILWTGVGDSASAQRAHRLHVREILAKASTDLDQVNAAVVRAAENKFTN